MFNPSKSAQFLAKSRNCTSETGIYHPPKEALRQNASDERIFPRIPFLPPLGKTQSLPSNVFRNGSGQNQLARPPLPEPRKRPPLREMITITLKHVNAPNGLNFVQLATLISEVFETPRTVSSDLRLKKTLSNMISRGLLMQRSGLGQHDSTYELCSHGDDQSFNLIVKGKPLPVMQLWPTGHSLPKGCNQTCRPDPRKNKTKPSVSRLPQAVNIPRRPSKLDPMPFAPQADALMFQSFGKRAGLDALPEERRPNSPTVSGIDEEEPPSGLYNPVLPEMTPRIEEKGREQDTGGGGDAPAMVTTRKEDSSNKNFNPYGMRLGISRSPSVLDTLGADKSSLIASSRQPIVEKKEKRSIFGAEDNIFSLDIRDEPTTKSLGPVDYLSGLASLIDRYDK